MPNLIIEYSANLDNRLDIDELVSVLHEAAVGIDTLPTAGIRTRAVRRDHYRIADGHPDNAYVYLTLRIMQGRTMEQKQGAGKALFDTLCECVNPISTNTPLALTFEIQEINPETRWKGGNIRDYMANREQGKQ